MRDATEATWVSQREEIEGRQTMIREGGAVGGGRADCQMRVGVGVGVGDGGDGDGDGRGGKSGVWLLGVEVKQKRWVTVTMTLKRAKGRGHPLFRPPADKASPSPSPVHPRYPQIRKQLPFSFAPTRSRPLSGGLFSAPFHLRTGHPTHKHDSTYTDTTSPSPSPPH